MSFNFIRIDDVNSRDETCCPSNIFGEDLEHLADRGFDKAMKIKVIVFLLFHQIEVY